jgi:hypothetical protein
MRSSPQPESGALLVGFAQQMAPFLHFVLQTRRATYLMWSSSHADSLSASKGSRSPSLAALFLIRDRNIWNRPGTETYHRADRQVSITEALWASHGQQPGSESVLSCRECLARHSEYLDGEMDAVTAAMWRAHLAECPRCARYDRVLQRGIRTLTAQPQLLPQSDFMLQLQQRMLAEDRRAVMRPFSSMATASLAVAVMLAFAAWLPVMILAGEEKQAVAVAEAASAVATEIAWHGESAVESRASGHVHFARREVWLPSTATHVIETRYTPVVLESPIAPLSSSRAYPSAAD